jgi:hypothetical protein
VVCSRVQLGHLHVFCPDTAFSVGTAACRGVFHKYCPRYYTCRDTEPSNISEVYPACGPLAGCSPGPGGLMGICHVAPGHYTIHGEITAHHSLHSMQHSAFTTHSSLHFLTHSQSLASSRWHAPHTTYLPCTMHHAPYTIHHTPYTIHHTSYTMHHTRYTIHHTPYTIHHRMACLAALGPGRGGISD